MKSGQHRIAEAAPALGGAAKMDRNRNSGDAQPYAESQLEAEGRREALRREIDIWLARTRVRPPEL
jgi:hypothetical protein